jgi:hypothetical protein
VLLSADNKKDMQAWINAITSFWQTVEEKALKKATPVTTTQPTLTTVVVRTPSPPVKPSPEVKGNSVGENVPSVSEPTAQTHKKRTGKGKKLVS